MTVVCHVWPGISPFNVWDLPYFAWCGFAKAADEYVEKQGAS